MSPIKCRPQIKQALNLDFTEQTVVYIVVVGHVRGNETGRIEGSS